MCGMLETYMHLAVTSRRLLIVNLGLVSLLTGLGLRAPRAVG